MLIRRPARKTTAPALLSLSLMASLPTTAGAQGPTCTPAIDISRSLVVTDGALDKTKFAFSRTIDAILGSMAIAKTAENRENFVKSMLTSLQDDDMVNPVSGLRMKVEVRPLEAGLDPKKLLNPADPVGLVPIALFNRLDAAPIDWSNCGEHRIVYSFKAPIPPEAGLPPFRTSRLLLIFEARMDNASPQKAGFEGCRAVANFWRSLTDENDEKMRAERLEQFYFIGIAGASGPVVQAKNYGGPLGQVRGNIFMNSVAHQLRWQLREWIVVNSGQPTPASFVAVTVKDNPLSQFYLDANGPASDPDDGPLDAAKEASERAEFQNQFLNTSLARLLDPDVVRNFLKPGPPPYAAELDPANAGFDTEKYRIEVLNRFGARFENRFNEFQSVSQGDADNPQAKAGPTLQANLGIALGQFVIELPAKARRHANTQSRWRAQLRRLPSVHGRSAGCKDQRSDNRLAKERGLRARNGKRRTFRSVDNHLASISPGPALGSGLHRGGADPDGGRAKRLNGARERTSIPLAIAGHHRTRRERPSHAADTDARSRARHHRAASGGDPKTRILRD